jgi:hypothetical protein
MLLMTGLLQNFSNKNLIHQVKQLGILLVPTERLELSRLFVTTTSRLRVYQFHHDGNFLRPSSERLTSSVYLVLALPAA